MTELEQQLRDLINRFEQFASNRLTPEVTIQTDYVERLFSLLGWNMEHGAGDYNRQDYCRGVGIADGVLLIDGKPIIYLEVKRFGLIPSYEERKEHRIYRTPEEQQALRYARDPNGQLRAPYAVLTNFQRLFLFDARTEEIILHFDKPQDYLDRLDDLLYLSKERVVSGALERWRSRALRPDVDEEFLATLNRWRLQLAQGFYDANAHRRHELEGPQGDYQPLLAATQRFLDRLIIIQAADDKDLLIRRSPESVWAGVVQEFEERRSDPYRTQRPLRDIVVETFRNFSLLHNSEIFRPGHLCEQLEVDDDLLLGILKELSALNFRRLSPDILSTTYESYLGMSLSLNENGRFELKRKGEYAHSHGIVYTPFYIVHAIVRETLGRYLEDKEPEDIASLRVVDPACGSGSFLIAAFDVLWEFYHRHNLRRIEDESGQVEISQGSGQAHLLHAIDRRQVAPGTQRRRPIRDYSRLILERHLYGVDKDPEAVEIAAVNLLLRAFERMREEQPAPSSIRLPLLLNRNIKQGNSLLGVPISSDILNRFSAECGTQVGELVRIRGEIPKLERAAAERHPETVERLSELLQREATQSSTLAEHLAALMGEQHSPDRFEWCVEFPEVFFDAEGKVRADAGFTFVVGNPPYIRIQELRETHPEDAEYYRAHYTFSHGSFDIYVLFIERAFQVLAPGGQLGFIVSNKFLKAQYGAPLRYFLANKSALSKLVNFGDNQVFPRRSTYTALLFAQKVTAPDSRREWEYVLVPPLPDVRNNLPSILADVCGRPVRATTAASSEAAHVEVYDHTQLNSSPWVFLVGGERRLWESLDRTPVRLGDIASHIFQGLITGAESVYILQELAVNGETILVRSRADGEEYELESDLLKPLLSGRHVHRYGADATHQRLLFPYRRSGNQMRLISPAEFQARYPRTWEYLCKHAEALRRRERGRMDHDGWYGYSRHQNLDKHDVRKLALPRLVRRSTAMADLLGVYYLDNVDVNGCILQRDNPDWYLFIVAVLNSDPVDFYFRYNSVPFQNGYFSQNRQFVERLPICVPSSGDPLQNADVQAIVRLARQRALVTENKAHLIDYVARTLEEWPHRWIPLNMRTSGRGRSRRVERGYLGDSRFDEYLERIVMSDWHVNRVVQISVQEHYDTLRFSVRNEEGETREVLAIRVLSPELRRMMRLWGEVFLLKSHRRRNWGRGRAHHVVLNQFELPRFLNDRGNPHDAEETVQLASRILTRIERRLAAKNPEFHTDFDELVRAERELDEEINARVVHLFGLTDDEFKVIRDTLTSHEVNVDDEDEDG